MEQFIICLAYILVPVGLLFVISSFRNSKKNCSKRKLIYLGTIGVLITLISGLIIIFFQYAMALLRNWLKAA
jgi:hypothetical protein